MSEELAVNGGKPVRDSFLVFGSPCIAQDEIDEVVDSLKSGWLGTGPKVERFQNMFKEYVCAKHAVALNSCTAAMHLALKVIGIKEGDEVITTPMTFPATANVIVHAGGKPVFVDVKRSTMNIDEDLIEEKITEKTKAILPVHMAGRPCDMDKIMKIARNHNLFVIEDAAHAVEAWYKGKKIGAIGDMTCFSFYVTKNLTTGEGGMVTTNNLDWAEQVKILSLHGLSSGAWARYAEKGFKHYEAVMCGFKYNMTDIQAALGIHQLEKLEGYLKIREKIWKEYDAGFKDLPVIIPKAAEEDTVHARHLYTPLFNIDELKCSRDAIQQALRRENIGTGTHFVSLHLHHYYKERFGFKRGDFPNAEFVSDRTVSLPLSAKLSYKDVADVIAAVKKVSAQYAR